MSLLFGAVFVQASCTDDGDDDPDDGGDTRTTVARADPTVIGQDVSFPSKGYSARIPQGWTFDPNAIVFGNLSSDLFLAPAGADPVQASIAVTCETIPAALSLQEYVEAKTATLEELTGSELTPRTVQVSGQEASQVEYGQTREDITLSRRDVITVEDECAWSISLSAPGGQLADYEDVFNSFLAEFVFT